VEKARGRPDEAPAPIEQKKTGKGLPLMLGA